MKSLQPNQKAILIRIVRITWLHPDLTPVVTLKSKLQPFQGRERWNVSNKEHEGLAYFSEELCLSEHEAIAAFELQFLNTRLADSEIEQHRQRAMITIKAAAEKL